MPKESFANAVRDKLGFLLTEHGFRIVHEGEHCVRLEAVSLSAEAVLDPRGGRSTSTCSAVGTGSPGCGRTSGWLARRLSHACWRSLVSEFAPKGRCSWVTPSSRRVSPDRETQWPALP